MITSLTPDRGSPCHQGLPAWISATFLANNSELGPMASAGCTGRSVSFIPSWPVGIDEKLVERTVSRTVPLGYSLPTASSALIEV